MNQYFAELDINISFQSFSWSGNNSHRARHKSSKLLAEEVSKVRMSGEYDDIFAIAHSHGGNIALFSQKYLHPEKQLNGIVTLGTPFINVNLRREYQGMGRRDLINSAKFGFFKTLALLIIVLFSSPFVVLFPALFVGRYFGENGGWISLILMFPIPFISFFLLRRYMAKFFFHFSAQKTALKINAAFSVPDIPYTHFLSIEHEKDEAEIILSTLSKPSTFIWGALENLRISRRLVTSQLPYAGAYIGFVLSLILIPFISPELATSIMFHAIGYSLVPALIWFLIAIIGYLFSLLRGHPGGFGWERPLVHSFVNIRSTVEAPLNGVFSYDREIVHSHQTDTMSGLNHSKFYNNPDTVSFIAKWLEGVVLANKKNVQ